MSHYFALLSIVYMMGFVLVFDNFHLRRCNARFWKTGLLSRAEVERLMKILSACQEG
jgi:hypothetical protein